VAVRVAAALGTALKRGARVVASRESPPACRLIKRAMISGLNSTGVHVADLRVLPATVGRHLLKTHGYDAGVHVGTSATDPEVVQIRFFEQPGIQLTSAMQKEVEKHFARHELRRTAYDEVGNVTYPARVRESYAQDLLANLEQETIRRRGFRIVVDFGHSTASFVLPLLMGPLGVEVVSAHAFSDAPHATITIRESIGQAKRLVKAIGADLGAVFDRSAERLFLVDERAREIPVEQVLLLFLRLLGSDGRRGKIAFPVTVTGQVERLASETGLDVVRTPAGPAELTRAASDGGVVFAAAVGGTYVFPEFLPAYDAMAALCKLLELLAPLDVPLSELVAELPESRVLHRQLACPWGMKGLVMRVLATSRSCTSTRRARPRTRRRSWSPSCGRSSRRSSRARGRRRGSRSKLESQVEVDPSATPCFTG
jgi:mannose-1-phosphate guanylyltransferase/phosphomannomutase